MKTRKKICKNHHHSTCSNCTCRGETKVISQTTTYVKVASIGHTLVTIQELLPVVRIVQTEKADVLLLLRGHDSGLVPNGSRGDGRIGRSPEGRNHLGLGLSGGCAERPLPSRTGIVGLLVLGGRGRGGKGCGREHQVRKCSVEPHYCFGLCLVDSVLLVYFGGGDDRFVAICARFLFSRINQRMFPSAIYAR